MVDPAFVAKYSFRVATLFFAFWCVLVVWPLSAWSITAAKIVAGVGVVLAIAVVARQRQRARAR